MEEKGSSRNQNVVDISQAKKKRLTLGFSKFGRGSKSNAQNSAPKKTFLRYFWTTLQVVVFLILVAYFMKLCNF